MCFDDVRPAPDVCDPCVSRREEMIVNGEHIRVEKLCAKIARGLQGHMAARTIELGLVRIIKAAGVVARDAAQEKCVVMILAAKEVLVLREVTRQTHLVTGGTKLGA